MKLHFTPPCAIMVSCLVKVGANFAFTLTTNFSNQIPPRGLLVKERDVIILHTDITVKLLSSRNIPDVN